MKLKKYSANALRETFLGTILLALYNEGLLNKWQVVKHYNNITKMIQKNGPMNLNDIVNIIDVKLPLNFCVVYHEDGKYAPVATRFVTDETTGQKILLPVTLERGYDDILCLTDDPKVHVIIQQVNDIVVNAE